MRSIDERIVEMRFDNKQFESGVDTTLKSLSKLKEGLKLDKAVSGLSELDRAAKGFSLSNVANAADIVAKRFSTMGIIGTTHLQRIADKALDTADRIVKSFTTQPVTTGFAEYETQINAVQTILSNTQREGATLEKVNRTLDELNEYADKTIYNFTEMTRNIGTFTAAGVDLKTSTSAIKGIANLAAISGSTSQQASTAMYQLSQALASGTVKLMDWNSVVNAGMGGAVFQDALKETARLHGIKIDEMIKEEGSFRETLQKGWLTSSILTETLQKFTGELSEEQLKAMGYTEEQAEAIYKMGQDANNAATKVKTLTQLMDTLKEAAQSGWSQSWRIVIGDFEEAKALLTEVSNAFGRLIEKTAESRNLVLTQWKDLGGRTALIESFKNIFTGLDAILTSVKASFQDIFPKVTGQNLMDLTTKIKNATEMFKNLFWYKKSYTGTALETSEGILHETETFYQFSPVLQKFVKIFKGVFSVAKIATKGILAFGNAVWDALVYCEPVFDGILDIFVAVCESITNIATLIQDTAHIGDWSVDFKNSMKPIIDIMPKATKSITDHVKSVNTYIKESGLIQNGIGKAKKVFGDIGTITLTAFGSISKFVTGIWEYLKTNEAFKKWIETAKTSVKDFGTKIGEFYTKVVTALKEFVSMDPEEYEAFMTALKTKFDKIKKIGDIPVAVAELISEWWGKSSETLKTAGQTIYDAIEWVKEKVVAVVDFLGKFGISLQKIGGGVLLIAVARFVLSMMSITKAIAGVVAGFGESLGNITSTLTEFAKNKFIKRDTIGTTLLKIAGSIAILVGAIWLLSKIEPEKIATGGALLAGLAVGLFIFAQGIETLGNLNANNFKKQTDALMKIAGSMIVMAGAIWLLGNINPETLGQGISALGGVLAELGVFLNLTKGAGYSLATNFFTLALAIVAMTYAVKTFADMESLGDATKGLGILGAVLAELGGFMKLTAGTGFSGATSFFGLASVLMSMVRVIEKAADINVGDGAKGLAGIGVMLTELGGFLKIANGSSFKGGLNLIGMALAMNMLVPALEKMGTLDLVTLAQGVGSLSTIMLGIAGAMRIMSGFTGGFGSIISLIVFAGSLTVFAEAMERLTQMSMAKMLAASGAFSMAIGTFAGSFGILSAIPASLALNGIVTIAIAIGGIAAIVSAIGAISNIPGFDWAMNQGGDALYKIGSAIGKFIQGIKNPDGTNAVTSTDTNGFEKIGTDLDALITNLQPFFDSVSKIDETVVTGVTNLGSILTTLIGASFWDRLLAWGDDTSALEGFSKSLIPFGQNMVLYADAVAGLDTDAVVKSATAAQMLADFASTISESRSIIAELLTGESNLENFANGLAVLGPSLKTYADNITDIDNDAVTKSANAAGLIAEFAVKLNESTTPIDNIVSKITGANSITTFATGLEALGPSLKQYNDDIKGITWSSVTKSANAAKLLGEFASNLNDNTGFIDNIVSKITGANSITTFATGLEALGPSFKQYASDVAGVDTTAVENSANAAKMLVEFEKELMAEGGVFNAVKTWLMGEKSLVTFSENLVTFGANMSTFSSYFSSEDTTMSTAISTVGTLLDELSALFGENSNPLDINVYKVEQLGFVLQSIVDHINEYSPEFEVSGFSIMTSLSNGMSRVTNVLPASMRDLMWRCVLAINNNYFQFYNSGMYIVQGLASGIAANSNLAAIAAANVATRALNAFNARLKINSPSKEFEKSGMYSDQGVAGGFLKYSYLITDAAKKIGGRAIDVMSTALNSIDGIINSDLNFNPVITPVIDSTELSNGIAMMNSMLSNKSISVGSINTTGLNRTIGATTAALGQNGVYVGDNVRVVEAIKDLGNRMDQMADAISKMKVVLDSGATVGQLEGEINRRMGRRITHSERGM